MDRFIAEMGISDVENMQQFKIQYGQIYSYHDNFLDFAPYNLKSNMDRFIESISFVQSCVSGYLKSNMDRFIAGLVTTPLSFCHI